MRTSAPWGKPGVGALAVALLGLAAVALGAAEPETPGPAGAQSLTLDETIRLCLERSPEVARARAEVRLREGALREVKGSFDATLRVTTFVEHQESSLWPQTYADEYKRRLGFSAVAKAFDEVRDRLAYSIEQKKLGRPLCPSQFGDWTVTLEGVDLSLKPCDPVDVVPSFSATPSPESVDEFVRGLFASPVGGAPATLDFLSNLSDLVGSGTEQAAEDARQKALEGMEESYRLATEVQTRAELALKRLGTFPDHEYQRKLNLSVGLAKPFKIGTILKLEGSIESVEDNFSGRPLDPAFGAKGPQNVFRPNGSLTLSQPLLRRRGATSVAASERAARQNLEAAREKYRHVLAEQVLASCQSYADLVAAQDTLAVLLDAAEAQRKVRDGTRTLLRARDVARTELTRAEARLAELEANAAQARSSLAQAQAGLAITLGLDAPAGSGADITAGDALAEEPLTIDAAAVAENARTRRHDLAAALALKAASRFLFDGARADTRPKLDLAVRAGVASDYFGPFFRVFKEETKRDPYEPDLPPVDYFNPGGFSRAFKDRWLPFVAVQLTLELPFGNNAAQGRLAQSHATYRRSTITAANVGRLVDQGVMEKAAVLSHAGRELTRRREAVAQHDTNWKNAQALRSAGELSMIDTLLTEQQRLSAQLELIRARRDYAAALAQFRFEAGVLIAGSPAAEQPDLSGLTRPPR